MNIRLSSKEQEKLVLENQKLVVYVVKKFFYSKKEYEDLISIGTIGLINAAITFSELKNIKFSTYACACIKNEILRHIYKEKRNPKYISLEDILYEQDGDQLKYERFIDSKEENFIDKLEREEYVIKYMNIILNLLKPKERFIMLNRISGMSMEKVAVLSNISKARVGAVEQRVKVKVKSYLRIWKEFKEIFSMHIFRNSYGISISSKYANDFNIILVTFLKDLEQEKKLPKYRIVYQKKQIMIQVPACAESFAFIARIIREIDKKIDNVYISTKNKK